ncbi:MAG: hypothetical protein SGJ07_06575 [Rhodospirillaceae bacterium]|nr:hypothetical protein [Rhodospirillaceae bacterium]
MTDGNPGSAAPAARATMTRGIAHAVSVVLALFVGGFALLFILSRAQEDGEWAAHPLDFLLNLYGAVGGVGAFALLSLVWLAFFMVLTELLACTLVARARGLSVAIAIEVIAFALFLAVWYLPQRIG